MSVIWIKVWADIWQHKARTFLAVLSIAAGVFAIGTIFGLVNQLLSTMDAAHESVAPSHMNIVLRGTIDRDTARSLANIPGVAGIELLNITSVRYKTEVDGRWEGATIVMRDDYTNQLYDWLILKEGAWPHGGNIAVERITSDYYGIDIGDSVIFELDGTDRALPVTGKIRHPFVPPPDFGGNAYFFVDAEGLARFGIPQGQFTQMLVRVEPYSEEYARDRAAAIKDQLAKQNMGVAVTIFQKPDEHWGRPFLEGITIVLRVLAVVSLLTSVIIVANTMTAIITQQTDQIGVIKAIGGQSGLIVKVFLAGVLIYGFLALAVALPTGLIAAYQGSKWFLALFNIDYETFQFSQRAVFLQVLAAVAAPIVAALWPVLSGAAISVREAIASYGIGGDFGSSKLDRTIEKLGEKVLPSPYAIALGNMFRRKGRLALTQLVLILAGTMFLMVITLANSMTFTLDNEMDRRQYDMRIFFSSLQRADEVEAIARETPNVVDAEAWFTVSGTVLREGERVQDTAGLGAEVYAIPQDSTMYQPYIVDGRWLAPTDAGNRVAVISQDTAEFNNLRVGDTITIDFGNLGTADWEVIGTYQMLTADPISTDPIYAPATAVVDVTKKANRANQIVIRTVQHDGEFTAVMMNALNDIYKTRGVETSAFFSRTKAADAEYAFNQFNIINSMLFGLALVMGVVGGIGLMGSLWISVVERTREIGVLRSIGAQSPTIMTMFVMEGVLQGIMSWLVAVPLAFLAARPMANLLGQTILKIDLDFAFSYSGVVIWLVAILSIAFLASLIPAHAATRISVRQSLAYG
ncbi:MAG: ABC transporter permease [Chloroflexi bacterium]|nr:ABC transporter permease [Chloroflexota bacterium]MBP7044590.1 ABC transporter permease [Chloroflexota bacterium]